MALIMPNRFWTLTEMVALDGAQSFSELVPVALTVLRRMSGRIAQVCGPMTTGGPLEIASLSTPEERFEANLARFRRGMRAVEKRNYSVFDQLPFQVAMIRIAATHHVEGYCYPLLTDFYRPIFSSGLVDEFFFMPHWQTSTGTSWERAELTNLSLPIREIQPEWL